MLTATLFAFTQLTDALLMIRWHLCCLYNIKQTWMQGKLFVDEHYSVKTDLDAMEANFWERCISTDNLYIVYYRNVICNNLQDKANVRKQESICWSMHWSSFSKFESSSVYSLCNKSSFSNQFGVSCETDQRSRWWGWSCNGRSFVSGTAETKACPARFVSCRFLRRRFQGRPESSPT